MRASFLYVGNTADTDLLEFVVHSLMVNFSLRYLHVNFFIHFAPPSAALLLIRKKIHKFCEIVCEGTDVLVVLENIVKHFSEALLNIEEETKL